MNVGGGVSGREVSSSSHGQCVVWAYRDFLPVSRRQIERSVLLDL